MTISSTVRKAGPFVGTGLVYTYPFTFKVFQASDVLVQQIDTSGNITTLTLTSQYSVSLNSDQNNNPGGSITLVTALPTSYQLVIGSQVPELQSTVITNNGGFYPQVITDALDKLTILVQQQQQYSNNSLQIPQALSGVGVTVSPKANNLLGWDAAGANLVDVDPSTLIQVSAYGTANGDKFTATAGQTVFTLSGNPGGINNLDVSLDGATLVPTLDYSWAAPYTLTLTGGAKAGQTLFVRYLQALPQGTFTAGGSSGQILYNNGNQVSGFTMTGDVTVNPSTGNAKVAQASAANLKYMSSVSCFGDSLTQATGGQTPYPTQLSAITGYNTVNNGVGGYTSSQILTVFQGVPTQWPNLTIIWAGRNNYNSPTQVLSDIATMVADIGHDGYLVLSILNNNTEVSGSAGYNAIAYLNSQLASIYGSHYLDVRSILVAAYNPGNPTDVTDHANDCPPSSLRYDTLHLNSAGYGIVAAAIKNVVSTLRGTRGVPVSSAGTVDLLSSPPEIGVVSPNVGSFTTLTGTTISATTSATIAGKTITLSGDSTSLQFPSFVIPTADNSYNLGYGPSQYRWANGYFSAQLTCNNIVINGKTLNVSSDLTSLQVNGLFIPSTDATYDLGYSPTTQRWRNGNFSGTVTAGQITSTAGISGQTHNSNYKTYAVSSGASQDLLSVGSYQATANGFLAIRCAKSGGVTVSLFAVSMMGSGTPSTYTPISTQNYGTGSATFTITESSAAGVNKLTFNNTSGAAVNITVTPMWVYVDGSAVITYF